MNINEALKRIEQWTAQPDLMFDWRSDTLKLACLVLEDILKNPQGAGRAKDLSRIRAVAQLQSLMVAMESMRINVPIVCPNCEHEHTLK